MLQSYWWVASAKENRSSSIRRAGAVAAITIGLVLSGCMGTISGCLGMVAEAQKEASQLETGLHAQMAKGDLAGIYEQSDPGFKKETTREQSDALFGAVARKLGAPLDCTQGGTTISATTSGTIIHSQCTTRFSKNATGVETFLWRKDGNQYRLFGYNVNSRELVER